MSDHHGHGCHDEHRDGHSHSHETPLEDIPRETLWGIVDHQNVLAFNVTAQNNIIKPWEERNDETIFLESDADDQMMIRIPFTDASAKLLSILIKAGPGEQTPARVQLFVNEDSMDFDDVAGKQPAQEVEIPQSRDVCEFQLKPTKFASVRTLTVFVPEAQGAESCRLYYIGFTGSFVKISNQPIIAVYEASPRLADHKVTGIHEQLAKQQF
ncbi:SubName: Full=Uncharacterized protein {ECO:0000313/EMBL:CCA68459.1} [Serendipita indica DSM 11827]|uniref:PITH domain-containing protein n=1 Tax=Serendipita indica (strain DSM 11827) TaxID=1109443 RepID=G4TAX3_SERID|nr:SubName: Full=Uncharacterized protein {ECO:0000313/EMBL:CCA68459.1} [Serendipita indica DSM 11827]CCA68459.1 hypothetical protein PIIN_02323 [Serendipita indica DSM 11827]